MPGDLPPREGRLNVTEESDTLEAKGTVVSLSEVARPFNLEEREHELRQWVAEKVIPAFTWANGFTLLALVALVALDEVNLAYHLITPGDRIITEKVIMALLGATTLQVGAIAYAIARYLFPERRR